MGEEFSQQLGRHIEQVRYPLWMSRHRVASSHEDVPRSANAFFIAPPWKSCICAISAPSSLVGFGESLLYWRTIDSSELLSASSPTSAGCTRAFIRNKPLPAPEKGISVSISVSEMWLRDACANGNCEFNALRTAAISCAVGSGFPLHCNSTCASTEG